MNLILHSIGSNISFQEDVSLLICFSCVISDYKLVQSYSFLLLIH